MTGCNCQNTKKFLSKIKQLEKRNAELEEKNEVYQNIVKDLKENQQWWKILFEYAPDVYYINDLKGNFIDGNRAVEGLIGYKKEELLGKDFLKLNIIPKRYMSKAAKVLSKNVAGLPSGPDVFLLNTKKGKKIAVELRSYPVRIGGKRVVLGIAHDITKRKLVEAELKNYREQLEDMVLDRAAKLSEEMYEREQAEEALRESENKFRMLFENAKEGIIFLNPDGNIIDVNPKILEIAACKRQDIVNKQFQDLITDFKMDPEKLLPAFDNIIMGEEFRNFEWEITNKAGKELTLLAHPSLIIKEGELLGLTVIVEDITEEKQAEKTLKENEEKLRMIFDGARDGFALLDKNGQVTAVNNQLIEVSGYSESDIIGKSILELEMFPLKSLETMSENFEKILMGADIPPIETEVTLKNGKKITVEILASLIKTGDELTGVIASLRDVSERKEAEEKVKDERNRAELYLDILGHDISNLNQTLLTSTELLLNKPGLPEEHKKYVELLFDQAEAVAKLLSNVRKLSNMQESELQLKSIELSSVLNDSLERLKQANSDRQITINHSIPESGFFVRGNELLHDVFDNIIGNAIKYDRNENVVVDVSIVPEADGKFWKMEFNDYGPGIKDENKDKIFRRLERGENSLKGSGLGLAIAYEVLGQFGGKIWVEDRISGDYSKGSKFVVLLPKGSHYV